MTDSKSGTAPQSAAQLLQQGLFHHRRGELSAAMDNYTQVLRNDPHNADALYYVAAVACAEDQFEEGIKLARRALEFGPPQARVYNLIGKALERQGKHREALDSFELAIARDPKFAEAHGNRAALLAAAGHSADALAGFAQALALDPTAAPDWINHGALLHELGRYAEALASFDKALALLPDDPSVLMNRANTLAMLGRHDEAVSEYERALKRAPRLVTAHVQKGIALKERGRHDEALASFDAALAIEPDNVAALKSKGRLLYVLGRLDEARALVERANALDPADIRTYFDLAEMKRFAPGDAQLAAMEKLLADRAARSTGERIDLHFALGKAYGDIGDAERAFDQLAQGNALARGRIAYDEAAVLGRMARARAVFTPALLREKAGHGDPSDTPVFIVGMPRSGTTLIEQILASHPDVHGGGERQDFAIAIEAVTGRGDFPEQVPAMTPAQFGELGAAYLARLTAEAPAADRITDKMPGNFLYAGLIHLALPHARIVHVRRDARDTCVSCFSRRFAAALDFTYDLGELGRYYRGYERLMDHWRTLLPAGVLLDVQYEDVVADLEGQARRIVDFCGLEWDAACLSFHKTERPVNTASGAQVRQPLYDTSIGQWRAYGARLGPLLAALGLPAD